MGGLQRYAALPLALILAAIALAATLVFGVGVLKAFSPFGLSATVVWLAAMALALRTAAAPRPSVAILLAITLLSLLMRSWSVALTQGVALGADPMNYTNIAHALLEGRDMVVDDWRYGQGLRAYFPPLYPVLLAGFWAVFGDSAWSTLAMNTIIDAAAAWTLCDTARRLAGGGKNPGSGRNWGTAVAIAYLAYPSFALSAGIPQKESLTLMLIALLLRGTAGWLQADGGAARRWSHGLWLGVWWGLLALTQPSLAVAPAAIALVLIHRRGFAPVLRLGLTALPSLVVVMLPWWVRNWMLFGTFVPFTTASGFMTNAILQKHAVPFPPGLFDLPEPERSSVIGRLARERIAERPLGFLAETLRAQVVGFAYEEAPLARFRHTMPPISAADHARLAPLLQAGWVALLGSALAGTWRQFRKGQGDVVVWFCLALFVAIGATNIWFEFGERHRYVLTPFLMLIATGFWLRACRSGNSIPAENN